MNTIAVNPQIAIRNILFATDFDASSGRALPFASAIRDQYHATLFVAHVVPQEAYIYARPESLHQILKETGSYAGDALNRLALALKHNGARCRRLLSEGNVPLVLVHLLQQYSIDLAVIGTGSRTGVEKVLLGSVAEELIREAPCPVLTVGPLVATEGRVGFHNVLCATDFSPESFRAAQFAFSLAKEYRGRITLVHVMERPFDGYAASAKRQVEERLDALIPPDELLFAPKLAVENGHPDESILRFASNWSADIIVMGVRGAGAFAHAASHFGSIAHKVLCLARCPVLTVGTVQTIQQNGEGEEVKYGR